MCPQRRTLEDRRREDASELPGGDGHGPDRGLEDLPGKELPAGMRVTP